MKNIKKLTQALLLVFGFLLMNDAYAQSIPNHFFGQNAWMPDSVGTRVLNGKLHQNWGKVGASKASVVRIGGIAPDRDRLTNHQYIKMIDSIRAKGMEPVVQVPFYNWKYNAQQAAEIVNFINKVKNRNIKYWVIGNEPDLEYGYTTASQVAAYIKPFASAMKAADPSILTIGPECAWFNTGIIEGLTTPNGPHDITGKDAAGRYYIDIVSFHSYAFDGTQTRSSVVSKLTSQGGFQDNLITLKNRIAACNAAHNRNGASAVQMAVTEANVNYKNNASDNLWGLGVNSFIGGQYIAEMFAVALGQGTTMMNIWSVVEGNGTPLNIGYIDPTTGKRKPAYYHFKMMAENFKGNFIPGTSNQQNVKAFGSQNAQFIQVMVMNQDQGANHNATVRLNSSAISNSNPLKINVNAGINIEHNEQINANTTVLLTFNPQGSLIKRTVYSLNDHAANDLPPVTTLINGGGLTTGAGEIGASDEVSMKGFKINVFPNPANSKFTIEIDRKNIHEVKLEIEIFDLMGRLIFTKTSVFPDRQQVLDLTGNSIAEAVYIIRVREQGDKDNWQSDKIILFK
jgi:hypothetical protein